MPRIVDYWSLGIILYELIYSRLPWGSSESIDIVDLFYSIMTQPVWFPAFEDGEPRSSDGEEITGGVEVQVEEQKKISGPVSEAATGIIAALLEKQPSSRLGGVVAQVKAHAFFNQRGSELDWAAARRGELVPPTRELPPLKSASTAVPRLHPQTASARWSKIKPFARTPGNPKPNTVLLEPLHSKFKPALRTLTPVHGKSPL